MVQSFAALAASRQRGQHMSETFPKTPRNTVRRKPTRGQYDREAVHAVLDAGIFCHVGYVIDGQPFVIPTLYARDGDDVLLHGASTSRTMLHAGQHHPLCLSVALADGLVLARSVFSHSVNYRSAVLFGSGELIEEPEEKMEALRRFTEKLLPGRWEDCRPPTPVELKATAALRFTVESASAKVRTGGPHDDAEDLALPYWAGVLPLQLRYGVPQSASDLAPGIALPDYLRRIVDGA